MTDKGRHPRIARWGLCALCTVLLSTGSASAAVAPYSSYNYQNNNDGLIDAAAPDAYLPALVHDSLTLGLTLVAPEDLCIDAEGNIYIIDSGSNSLHSFTPDWKLRYTITRFADEQTFDGPTGLCTAPTGGVYVADTNHSRIVEFDADGAFVRIIEAPVSEIFPPGFVFRPRKISIDNSGRIFVIAKDVYEGIIQLNYDGSFIGYVGSNRVVVSPIAQIWRKIMSQAQNDASQSFVPVEYKNLCLDEQGFIFCVTSVENVAEPIRRLNPAGQDILLRNPVNGSGVVAGDLLYYNYSYDNSTTTGPSAFVDIAVDSRGIYYALDGKRGRIFANDEDGNMLFVFGGLRTGQRGTFDQPVALEVRENQIYVLDNLKASVSVFTPTDYTEQILAATESYIGGDYAEALILWEGLLKRNANFELAYVKAGFSLYRLGEYKQAMDYFILANAREQYSKAYEKYRRQNMDVNFTFWANAVVIASLSGYGASLFIRLWRKRRRRIKP